MNLHLLIPEFLTVALAFVVLAVDLFIPKSKKSKLQAISFIGLVSIAMVTVIFPQEGQLYDGLLVIDGFAQFIRVLILLLGAVVVLMSGKFIANKSEFPGEYYGIIIFTVVGGMLLGSSAELLTAYISLELMSFGFYVLVAFDRYNSASNEGGTKYILLGAFSSALILFGISNVYGLLGVTRFEEIGIALNVIPELSPGLIVGFGLIFAGFAFKLAAAPFHMWAPDVYDGAPISVTAWLATGSKIAVISLLIRFFVQGMLPTFSEWQIVVIVLCVLSMFIGNLIALAQSNLKRLMAYSGIGHMGYILLGVAALGLVLDQGSLSLGNTNAVVNGLIFHMVAYGISNLAFFYCLAEVNHHTDREDISSLAGLSKRHPLIALVMTSSLFSMAGLPVFVGFTSKFYLFSAVSNQDLLWLVGLAIVTSLISLYYYLMVIRQIYIENPHENSCITISKFTKIILGLFLVVMVIGGIYPQPMMNLIQVASEAVMSSGTVFNLL